MKTTLLICILAALLAGPAAAKVNVVASTTDLASITEAVGGDAVSVSSINRGGNDPHFVEVLPSYMVRVKKAQVYLLVGLDLDRWAYPIIDGSRNGKLLVVDCSKGIHPLEVPTGKTDASMGDVHPRGNPHYWLDPDNGVVIATNVADALMRVDSENASLYRAGLQRFKEQLEQRKPQWKEHASSLAGLEIITFHNSWPYFARVFGVNVVGFVEPLPGIEPTPSHTASLIEMVKARGIHIIGVEPYFSQRTPATIARESGAKVIELPPSVGGAPGADNYFALFDVIIDRLKTAPR